MKFPEKIHEYGKYQNGRQRVRVLLIYDNFSLKSVILVVNGWKTPRISSYSGDVVMSGEQACGGVWPLLSPPLMFQDPPPMHLLDSFATKLVTKLLAEAMDAAVKATWSIPCSQVCHMAGGGSSRSSVRRRRSIARGGTWGGSGGGLRLCWTPEQHPYSPCHGRETSSHTSLSVRDDSSALSTALSHDALTDIYTEPVGSDGYALPVNAQPAEPIHLTLQEVRHYLQSMYANEPARSETPPMRPAPDPRHRHRHRTIYRTVAAPPAPPAPHTRSLKQAICSVFRLKRIPTPTQCLGRKQTGGSNIVTDEIGARLSGHMDPPSPITKPPLSRRALPPLPPGEAPVPAATLAPPRSSDLPIDFAASIQKVKDYGWYWGNISGEVAEKILLQEPDGSFIVRDSSDDYYIFSLTFKLNSIVRHVRIEHDQGNFSFGNTTRFKSHTIVDFIESAVEHSRSGRYLFFLHRRPVLGPMRVQLLHPVSRFRDVQSLQHMTRFVILKTVRRDLITQLPLPRRLLEYLSTPHYYTEQPLDDGDVTNSGS